MKKENQQNIYDSMQSALQTLHAYFFSLLKCGAATVVTWGQSSVNFVRNGRRIYV